MQERCRFARQDKTSDGSGSSARRSPGGRRGARYLLSQTWRGVTARRPRRRLLFFFLLFTVGRRLTRRLALKDVEVKGETLAEIVGELDGMHPGLADYLVDEHGALRRHVNIFVNEQLLEDRAKLRDRVEPRDRVFIMQALSGG